VIDPKSGLDAVRTIDIRGRLIAAITTVAHAGQRKINARRLVLSPGFIDL